MILQLGMGVFAVDSKERCQLNQESNTPGNGIGEVQTLGRMELGHLEDRGDPANTNTTDAKHGDDHRGYGSAHTSQSAGGDIHQAAEEIGQADISQADHTIGDGFLGISNVDRQQRFSKIPGGDTEY